MAHYEPPHQDLRCLQIQLFSSSVLITKEVKLLLQDEPSNDTNYPVLRTSFLDKKFVVEKKKKTHIPVLVWILILIWFKDLPE